MDVISVSREASQNQTQLVWKGEPDLGGWYTEEEVEAAETAIRNSMDWRRGFLPHQEITSFETEFAAFVGGRRALAINGAGTGLDMAMRCLDLSPDDEVISCALNFPGTHLAVLGQGARLTLCEPDPVTLNIDVADLERKITTNTRAILVTHMSGLAADCNAIATVAARHAHPVHGPIKIIYDVARACGATYDGHRLGAEGWINVFSFQRKKLMTTLGEGGMIVCSDDETSRKLDQLRSFGAGEGWGTNYKLTKVQAAVGRVQLRRLDSMNAARVRRARLRTKALSDLAPIVQLPTEREGYDHVYYLYCVVLPDGWTRQRRDHLIIEMLRKYNVECKVANGPTYWENRLIRRFTEGQRLPLAESIGSRVICLPLHPLMTDEDDEYITSAFRDCLKLEVARRGCDLEACY